MKNIVYSALFSFAVLYFSQNINAMNIEEQEKAKAQQIKNLEPLNFDKNEKINHLEFEKPKKLSPEIYFNYNDDEASEYIKMLLAKDLIKGQSGK